MKNPDYPFYLNWRPAFEAQECLYDLTFGNCLDTIQLRFGPVISLL